MHDRQCARGGSHIEIANDRDYQLWMIRGEEKISAGLLVTQAGGGGTLRVAAELLEVGAPDAFAISIEPKGGMPQPTGPIVLVAPVPRVTQSSS